MLKKNFHICDRIARIALFVTGLLALIAFVPNGAFSGGLIKGYVVIVGVSVAFVCWLIARLMEGAVRFPRSWTLLSLGVLCFVVFLSTLFSHAPYLSLFGEQLDQGAFVPFIFMAIAVFLGAMLFQDKKDTAYFFSATFIVYAVLAVYQLAHLYFAQALSFGIFYSNVSTPVGLWSDFAYLSGAMLIGAVIVHEFFQFPKTVRIVISSVGVLALFFVVLTNNLLVWMLVGLSLLFVLVYRLLFSEQTDGTKFPLVSFILTVTALFFSIANVSFGGKLASLLHASYLGVDPSLSATLRVGYESIKSHLVLGIGPNRFFHEWIAYRPLSVNSSMLWNSVFSYGSSFLLTIMTMTGLLGVLAGIFFVGSFFMEGWRNLFRQSFHSERESIQPVVFITFVIALYFFCVMLFSSPGIAITFSAFLFMGILIATLSEYALLAQTTIHFAHKKWVGIIAICFVVIGTAFALFGVIGATKRLVVTSHYAAGVRFANAGDAGNADLQFTKALAVINLPSIERDRVRLAISAIQAEFAAIPKNATDLSQDAKQVIQNAIKVGTNASLAAISLDSNDVQNYLAYGDFMHTLTPLKIQAAFDNSRDAYLKAINVAPNYPVSYLDLAQLYADSGDTKNATAYATQALAIKPNYTDVFYLEAQMALAQSDVDSAVAIMKKAIAVDAGNAQLYSKLGQIQYQANRFTDATASFGSATTLDANDTLSWYYLAQSFAKTGDQKDASMILTALHARYPDDTDITNALLSLTNPVATPTTPATPDATKIKKPSTITPKPKK